jgi:DNA-directed RNA polymerase subunit L
VITLSGIFSVFIVISDVEDNGVNNYLLEGTKETKQIYYIAYSDPKPISANGVFRIKATIECDDAENIVTPQMICSALSLEVLNDR